MPRLQLSSLSVMVGTPRCTRRCPPCISRMTPRVGRGEQPVNLPLERVSFLAKQFLRVCGGIPYGIITGKGEPTLADAEYFDGVIDVLQKTGLVPELQTNGDRCSTENLRRWKGIGLNTLALSCVSHDDEANFRILNADAKIDLKRIVKEAREMGYLVRLTAMLCKGGVDSPDALMTFIRWAKEAGAHQLTFRRLGEPRVLALRGAEQVAQWIGANRVEPDFVIAKLREIGTEKEPWPWAQHFGYDGMSVVVTDHMNPPKDGVVRHAVIQPDGHLYGSWDDPADIII